MGYPICREIKDKVIGFKEINITNIETKKIGLKEPLVYYEGTVKFGDNLSSTLKSTILSFDKYQNEMLSVRYLHERLNLIYHPCVMRSFGCINGLVDKEGCLLVLPYFEELYSDYMKKGSRTIDLDRFSKEFIELTGSAVRGLVEVHSNNMYCPDLNGNHIAIVKEQNYISAKLWYIDICETGNEKCKETNWVSLGHMLKETAKNHKSLTVEINDLCEKMIHGTLQGIDCLEHSALKSVQEKFQKILALNMFVLTNLNEDVNSSGKGTPQNIQSKKDQAIANLKTLLKQHLGWKSNLPTWIKERVSASTKYEIPKDDTFQSFLWFVRCLIEHEDSYIPEEAIIKISSWEYRFRDFETDLEYEIRNAWPNHFLTALNTSQLFGLVY